MQTATDARTQERDNHLVMSYMALRRAIGLMGAALPVILLVYGLGWGGGLLPSISDYYYSPLREVFVGILCALAVFLWSYRGYDDRDRWLTDARVARVASLGALGVAWVPTVPMQPGPVVCTMAQCILGVDWASRVHYLSAALFFAALAVFCLVQFIRGGAETVEKRARNRIYRLCGRVIVACMVLIGLAAVAMPLAPKIQFSFVFWLETVACFAFAISWRVKGEALRPLVRAARAVEGAQNANAVP